MRIRRLPLAVCVLAGLLLAGVERRSGTGTGTGTGTGASNTCVTCHAGIEEMHPGWPLTCVECHGGDDTQTTKELAHVLPSTAVPTDERVRGRYDDLPYQRFVNPSNLRVAREVCGDCHRDLVEHLEKSLHGTTAGHLGDGFYENGLTDSKRPSYSIFPVRDEDGDVPEHALAATTQIPPFRSQGREDRIETHYTDLPRKACMQCHLYSEGRAVDGRLGMDGDYRGEGCAACHVLYADDGRSRSRDATIDRREPGHPIRHRLTSRIPTSTCTRCHYGDASIGLHYRGMAQLVPGMPAGPEVEGTTDELLNGTFYIEDPDMTPPDIHHERGMHCIDCHTLADSMGDGNIWPQMDHAVEIECTDCHGTYDRVSNLTTSHGRRIPNLVRRGDAFFLRSKVTGEEHPVAQVPHLLDPGHPGFNAEAARAMTPEHGRLECYACHAAWNVNFFGFHFDRNEQFTQLDLLSGRRTPGRVTTQEKVFATFNQLRLGFNHEGKIAPYMVGFSTIGSAHDDAGETVLWQATPETRAGLSGVTMIPHQMHSVRREARTCAECHRTAATFGMGSSNFQLTREFAYAVNASGLHTIAINAKTPARSQAVADLEIEGSPRALGLRCDPVHARATHAYVGCEDGTLAVVSLRNPVLPVLVREAEQLADPRRILVQGQHMYVADGVGGVVVFDLERPANPVQVGVFPTTDARSLALSFPWLVIADGAGGLVIADVSDPRNPTYVSDVDLNGESTAPNEAFDVAVLFQYSRTKRADDRLLRSDARHMAFVACGLDGVRLVDLTRPGEPELLEGRAARGAFRFDRGDVRGIAVNTVFDIGSAGGGLRSRERDMLYVHTVEGAGDRDSYVTAFDVTDPTQPQRTPRGRTRVPDGTGRLHLARSYNPPFLQHFVVAAGSGGIGALIDASRPSARLELAALWSGIEGLRDLALESFAFDRLQDEEGNPIKDISHEGCRYLTRTEVLRVLRAPLSSSAEDPHEEAPGRTMPRASRGPK